MGLACSSFFYTHTLTPACMHTHAYHLVMHSRFFTDFTTTGRKRTCLPVVLPKPTCLDLHHRAVSVPPTTLTMELILPISPSLSAHTSAATILPHLPQDFLYTCSPTATVFKFCSSILPVKTYLVHHPTYYCSPPCSSVSPFHTLFMDTYQTTHHHHTTGSTSLRSCPAHLHLGLLPAITVPHFPIYNRPYHHHLDLLPPLLLCGARLTSVRLLRTFAVSCLPCLTSF